MKSTEHPIITTVIITLTFFSHSHFLGLFLPFLDPMETIRECVVSYSFLYSPTYLQQCLSTVTAYKYCQNEIELNQSIFTHCTVGSINELE